MTASNLIIIIQPNAPGRDESGSISLVLWHIETENVYVASDFQTTQSDNTTCIIFVLILMRKLYVCKLNRLYVCE